MPRENKVLSEALTGGTLGLQLGQEILRILVEKGILTDAEADTVFDQAKAEAIKQVQTLTR